MERQWREDAHCSSLSRESEYLAVIRHKDTISVLWKQKSTVSDEKYLLRIILKKNDGELKQVGAWLS